MMMKPTLLLVSLPLLLVLLQATEAFVVVVPRSTSHRALVSLQTTTHIPDDALEASVDDDPYLAAQSKTVESLQHDREVQEFREKEAHKHDSLLDESEHSIDSDPYLKEGASSSMKKKKKTGIPKKTKDTMDKIEASIDTDPYLAAQAKTVDTLQHDREVKEWKDKEAHKHDSLLDEIEHSIDSDPTFSA